MCWPGLESHLKAQGKKDPLPSPRGRWQDSVPRGLLGFGRRSLLAASLSLPSVLCRVALPTGQFTAWQLASEPEGESLLARTLQSYGM